MTNNDCGKTTYLRAKKKIQRIYGRLSAEESFHYKFGKIDKSFCNFFIMTFF